MKKVVFEELVINSIILLKTRYNISKITSPQLEKYKEIIFKQLKNNNDLVNISLENPQEFKEKYNNYFNVDIIYDDFIIYELKPNIDINIIKENFSLDTCKDICSNDLVVNTLMNEVIKKDDKYIVSKIYNKLVRDNIPNKLQAKNEDIKFVILEKEKYKEKLYKNLEESYHKFINYPNLTSKIENSSDIIEILSSIISLETNSEDLLMKKTIEKKEREGNYNKRLCLEKISVNIK